MTRREKDRFLVRTPSGESIALLPLRRLAIDRARWEAKKRGQEIEVFDRLALVGAVEAWSVSPSGVVQANEIRSIESEKRALQSGAER